MPNEMSEELPALTDDQLRAMWRSAGGKFHGPNVETGTMPESDLLPFLRDLVALSRDREAAKVMSDLVHHGIAWLRDGKRIDPRETRIEQPSAADAWEAARKVGETLDVMVHDGGHRDVDDDDQTPTKPGPGEYSVWREGYAATGERDTARFLGTFKADSFEAACKMAGADGQHGGRPSWWACRMFDNETDARKAFG